MSKYLQRDIQEIHDRLLAQVAVVEQMVDKATQALCQGRVELVDEVIQTDDEVNHMEVRIEEECLKILALHQPVAIVLGPGGR